MKICIVDDSKAFCKQLSYILTKNNKIEIVGIAHDGMTGLDYIQEQKPDAVVLDIEMPELNGIEVLKIIKNSSKPPIVIMLTNYADAQYRKMSIEKGADYFFSKSEEFFKVNDVINELSNKVL